MVNTEHRVASEPDKQPRQPGIHGLLVSLERVVVVILISAVLGLLVAQVYFRYVARNPLLWSDEAARISLIYLTFVGAGLVASSDSHIAMELIDTKLGIRGRKILRVSVNILMILASSLVVYTAIPAIQRAMTQYTTAMEIRFAYLYGAGALGLSLLILHSVRNVVNIIRGRIDVSTQELPGNLL
jgi:TRAP-type C4-dicarboxylate transport system permease small subunit